MATPDKKIYDKSDIFESKILPLLDEMERICVREQIPFFCSFATANEENKTKYEHRARTAAPMGFTLTNDLLVNHVKVCAGFEVIIPESMPEIHL